LAILLLHLKIILPISLCTASASSHTTSPHTTAPYSSTGLTSAFHTMQQSLGGSSPLLIPIAHTNIILFLASATYLAFSVLKLRPLTRSTPRYLYESVSSISTPANIHFLSTFVSLDFLPNNITSLFPFFGFTRNLHFLL